MQNVDVTAVASQGEGHAVLILTCEACLDISVAQAWYRKLQDCLERHQAVQFHGAQVERVDTAMLQLLSAFIQEARGRGMAVDWQQPSPALRQAARLLDLMHSLALPIE
jgi:ABC-type transporter Mla MlaB component